MRYETRGGEEVAMGEGQEGKRGSKRWTLSLDYSEDRRFRSSCSSKWPKVGDMRP